MVAGGKKVSGCEIKIWLDYAICGGERGFECLSLNVLEKKKLIWKEGSRQLLSLSFSLNEFQAARVSAWQESRHPVIRTTQRILFSWSWVVIMAVCRVGNKMSVFWEELWDVPCRGLHQCPPGWHDVVKPVCMTLDISAAIIWIFGQQRRYHWVGYSQILSPCQGDSSDPSPHPHDPWCSKHSRLRVSHFDCPHYARIMVKHT